LKEVHQQGAGKTKGGSSLIALYGNTVTTQHKCLKCGSLFFPEKDEFVCSWCVGKKIGKPKTRCPKVVQKIAPKIQRRSIPRKRILERDNYTCQYCGVSSKENCLVKLTIDHFIPFVHGGNNKFNNLLTACWDCHKHKSDKIFDSMEEAKKFIANRREAREK